METTRSDLVQQLRQLADSLEQAELPQTLDVSVDLSAHRVNDRNSLRQWVAVIQSPEAWASRGVHGVTGKIAGIDVTAFYAAGLLGRVEKTRIVEQEEAPDLGSLFNDGEAAGEIEEQHAVAQ